MSDKYKIAIFDMDGTILDTLTDIYNAINHSLEVFGLPQRTKEEVRMFVGNGLRKLVERAVPVNTNENIIENVLSELLSYYGEHSSDTTAPYLGINDAIASLKERGIITAVVSNKADFAVQILNEQFFDGLFDYAIGEHEGFNPKPEPDMVNEILKRANVTCDKSVYIGDSDVDLMTAENSNMDCIAVAWGFRSVEFLKEHGAQIIANKPEELIELI